MIKNPGHALDQGILKPFLFIQGRFFLHPFHILLFQGTNGFLQRLAHGINGLGQFTEFIRAVKFKLLPQISRLDFPGLSGQYFQGIHDESLGHQPH